MRGLPRHPKELLSWLGPSQALVTGRGISVPPRQTSQADSESLACVKQVISTISVKWDTGLDSLGGFCPGHLV